MQGHNVNQLALMKLAGLFGRCQRLETLLKMKRLQSAQRSSIWTLECSHLE